ncbi:MAG: hypothetical protein EPO40_30995 [Myxococcaceae bacterium]|nr:MAG: hypothetical protein EPO40_30995 [Myxococcaceae bacterium]
MTHDRDRAFTLPPVQVFDGVASVAVGDTLLTLWQAPARAARIRHVTEVASALVRRREGSIAACQFLLPSASPPRLQERSEISAGLDVVMPRARRLVTTPLGDAAWQAVVRSVMRAGLFLIGQSTLVKVAASPAEAFELLGQVSTEESPGHRELEGALSALYDALKVP